MARHMATSSFAAQAKGGLRPRPSTAVTDAPLANNVSTTSIMPKGAAKCKGLNQEKMAETVLVVTNEIFELTFGLFCFGAKYRWIWSLSI